jgi:hypothetical protein
LPLFMDTHHKIDGLTAEAIKGAHEQDLAVQNKYGVTYHKYWFDAGSGRAYCLVEAPDKESANAVHREAHGLVADELIQVQEGS